jgi:hypothetical protein
LKKVVYVLKHPSLPLFSLSLLKPKRVKDFCVKHEGVANAFLFVLWSWEKYWLYHELASNYKKPKKLFAHTVWEGLTMQAAENFKQWAFEHKTVLNLTNETNVYYNQAK